MDLKAIKELNDASVAVFEEFSTRQRAKRETNLRALRRELTKKFGPIDHNQLMDTFKALEKAGAGSLVIGRGAKPTRFMWQYSLREVAHAAQKGTPLTQVAKFEPTQPVMPGMMPPPKVKPAAAPVKSPVLVKAPDILEIFVLENSKLKRYKVTDKETVTNLRSILAGL